MLIDGRWKNVSIQEFCHLSGLSKYDAEKMLNKMLVGETSKTELGYHFQVSDRTWELTETEQRERSNKLSNFERQISEMERLGKPEKAEQIKKVKEKYLAEIELEDQQMGIEQEAQQLAFNGSSISEHKTASQKIQELLDRNRQELEMLKNEQAEYLKRKEQPKEETLTKEEQAIIEETKKEIEVKSDNDFISQMVEKAISETLANLGLEGNGS